MTMLHHLAQKRRVVRQDLELKHDDTETYNLNERSLHFSVYLSTKLSFHHPGRYLRTSTIEFLSLLPVEGIEPPTLF